MYDVKDRQGTPLRKGWRIQSQFPAMSRVLSRRCGGKRLHVHGRCQGKDATLSGFYPAKFCRALLTGYLSAPQNEWAPADIAAAEDDDEDMSLEDEQESATMQLKSSRENSSYVNSAVRPLISSIRKLHNNLGHPSPQRLARAVRLSGGSETAVAAALAYRCPICAKLKPPVPANPASIAHVDLQAFDRVGIDLFTLADAHGRSQTFVNMVDWASSYQIVCPVPSKRPDVIFLARLTSWIIPLGCFKAIVSDRGGESEREFLEG